MIRVDEGRHGGVVIPQEEVWRLSLVALPSPQEAPVVKHVLGHRVQSPVVPLARVPGFTRDLDEAVV